LFWLQRQGEERILPLRSTSIRTSKKASTKVISKVKFLICPELNASLMLKTADPRRKDFVKGSTMHPLLKKEDQVRRQVYALPGHITPDQNSWLVDSGVSKQMTGYKNILPDFQKKTCSVQIQLGDISCHDSKGSVPLLFS
jgi:hypothetical protein